MANPLFNLLVYGAFGLALAGPCILVLQIGKWLVSGAWPSWTLGWAARNIFGPSDQLTWLGLRKLAEFAGQAHLWIALPIICLLFVNVMFWALDAFDKK